MKHSPLTLLFVSMLLTPAIGAAQDAPTDAPADDAAASAPSVDPAVAPAADGDAANAPAPANGSATPANGSATPAAQEPEPAAQEPAPAAQEPAPAVEPEPEVSAVETAAGLGQMQDDLAASDAEGLGHAEEATDETNGGDSDTAGDEAEESSLPWSALFLWDQSMSVDTFSRSRRLTYNPTYTWSFSLRPRWTFGGGERDTSTAAQQAGAGAGSTGISVGYRQDLEIEMTQSDSTTTQHQLLWSDGILDAGYTLLHSDMVHLGAKVSLQLPWSLASRAAKRIVAPGLGLSAVHTFHALEGIQLAGTFGYKHWLATSNTAALGERDPVRDIPVILNTPSNGSPYPCEVVAGSGAPTTGGCNSGSTTGRDYLNATLALVVVPIEDFSISTSITWVWTRGNNLGEVAISDTGVITAPSMDTTLGDNQTHWRNASVFSLGVGYDLASYLSLEASYSTLALNVNENGARFENPLWNEKSSVSLTATLRLDALYSQVHQAPTTAANETPAATAVGDDNTPTAQADSADGSTAQAANGQAWW